MKNEILVLLRRKLAVYVNTSLKFPFIRHCYVNVVDVYLEIHGG